MKTSTNGRKFIEQYEGLFLQSYDDYNDHIVKKGDSTTGTITIGYGHTTSAGLPKVTPGMIITKEQADNILASDLSKVEAQVNALVKVPLTQNQFDALVSFQFNTGSLGKSSILTELNKNNYDEAANRFALYNNARVGGKLKPSAGLTRRRADEKAMFLRKDANPGAAAAATVIAGGVTAASAPHNYMPWIIGGTAVLAIALFIGYTIYEYKKSLINKG